MALIDRFSSFVLNGSRMLRLPRATVIDSVRQIMKELEDIGKHSHGRDIGSGTRTLNNKRCP
jgi:hypothetical protein